MTSSLPHHPGPVPGKASLAICTPAPLPTLLLGAVGHGHGHCTVARLRRPEEGGGGQIFSGIFGIFDFFCIEILSILNGPNQKMLKKG